MAGHHGQSPAGRGPGAGAARGVRGPGLGGRRRRGRRRGPAGGGPAAAGRRAAPGGAGDGGRRSPTADLRRPPRRPPQDRAAGTAARLVADPGRRLGGRGPAHPVQHGAALPDGAAGPARPATRWSVCCTSAAPTRALLGLQRVAGGAGHAGGAGAGADRAERGGHPAQQRGVLPHAGAEHLGRHPDRRRRGPGPVRQPVRRHGVRRRPGRRAACYDVIHPDDRRRLADVLDRVRAGAGAGTGLDFRALGRRRTEVPLEVHCRDLRDDPTRGRARAHPAGRDRAPPARAGADPPGVPRLADRPGQPGAVRRPAGARAGPRRPGRRRWSACSSSTWTTSRSSTTRSATRSATSCWSRWPTGSPARCAPTTPRPGSAATSSPR